MYGNDKTQFTIHVGPIQILLKPRVCGKQISAAFRKPADTVESELHCSGMTGFDLVKKIQFLFLFLIVFYSKN